MNSADELWKNLCGFHSKWLWHVAGLVCVKQRERVRERGKREREREREQEEECR
jgi:hypothetical protein